MYAQCVILYKKSISYPLILILILTFKPTIGDIHYATITIIFKLN